MIEFKDAAVAAKYTTDQTVDKTVHLPGGKQAHMGWKGKLSAIPLAQADRWINRPGQNLLKLKPSVAEKAPVIEKKKLEKTEDS
jgi:hypothetical protein